MGGGKGEELKWLLLIGKIKKIIVSIKSLSLNANSSALMVACYFSILSRFISSRHVYGYY